jgi:adenosylcobinamide-GDP ribazoletransferase
LAKPFVENLKARDVLISSALTFGIVVLFMGLKGIAILLGIALFSLGYRLFFLKKLGGVTGDVLGAANEMVELLWLLLLAISETIHL